MGDSGGAVAHERRPSYHQAGVQSDIAEQEDHRSWPGSFGNTGQEDI